MIIQYPYRNRRKKPDHVVIENAEHAARVIQTVVKLSGWFHIQSAEEASFIREALRECIPPELKDEVMQELEYFEALMIHSSTKDS
jgi:bacterioferritin (cytochrome b1)